MSEKHWRFLNQLFTTLMLVVAMIACQQMPEHNSFSPIESESQIRQD